MTTAITARITHYAANSPCLTWPQITVAKKMTQANGSILLGVCYRETLHLGTPERGSRTTNHEQYSIRNTPTFLSR
jgi:hypothetical protein